MSGTLPGARELDLVARTRLSYALTASSLLNCLAPERNNSPLEVTLVTAAYGGFLMGTP